MMKEIKGSQTENNLRSAISGEAQARVMYELFATRAKEEGFRQIAEFFKETSKNEKAHAEIYLGLLKCIGTTQENLEQAMKTEHYENAVMYKDFAKTARDEGYAELAETFEKVGKIEEEHEKRFAELKNNLQTNAVFSKMEPVTWVCSNCGHELNGTNAPDICPVCKRPISYFEMKKNNY